MIDRASVRLLEKFNRPLVTPLLESGPNVTSMSREVIPLNTLCPAPSLMRMRPTVAWSEVISVCPSAIVPFSFVADALVNSTSLATAGSRLRPVA